MPHKVLRQWGGAGAKIGNSKQTQKGTPHSFPDAHFIFLVISQHQTPLVYCGKSVVFIANNQSLRLA